MAPSLREAEGGGARALGGRSITGADDRVWLGRHGDDGRVQLGSHGEHVHESSPSGGRLTRRGRGGSCPGTENTTAESDTTSTHQADVPRYPGKRESLRHIICTYTSNSIPTITYLRLI